MIKKYLFSTLVLVACSAPKQPDPMYAGADPVPMAADPTTDPATDPAADPTTPEEPTAPGEPSDRKVALLASETAAFQRAKPVFDKWCAKCHSKDGRNTSYKKRHELDTTTYPFAGEHATASEIRRVLGIGGGKITMPADKKGAVQGGELALIAAWADAWDAAHAGGAHAGQ